MDVAQAWRKVLDDAQDPGIVEEVIFAVSNRKLADAFAEAFGGEVEAGPRDSVGSEDDDGGETEDGVAKELQEKIQDMEQQLSKVWNADLKARMEVILDGLRAQLRARKGEAEEGSNFQDLRSDSDGEPSTDEEDYVVISDG